MSNKRNSRLTRYLQTKTHKNYAQTKTKKAILYQVSVSIFDIFPPFNPNTYCFCTPKKQQRFAKNLLGRIGKIEQNLFLYILIVSVES